MRTGRKLFAGVSLRTNTVGLDPLRRELTPFGYCVEAVEVRRCLHLKSVGAAAGVPHDRNLTFRGNLFARSE
jgi:N-dimethylarginine dimethylaminohydrolase